MGALNLELRYIPEPVIMMYLFATMMQMPVMQQYVYKEIAEKKGLVYDYSADSSTCESGVMNNTQKKLQDEVQQTAARFNIGQSLSVTIPTIISCLFYGVLSDQFGRRRIMLISCICSIIDSSIVLMTMVFKLPVLIIYIGSFFNGIGGAFTGLFMLAFAYLADVTDKEKLSVRMALLESTNFFGLCVSNYVSGPFIKNYAFVPPQILIVTLFMGATLYLIFVLKESLNYQQVEDKVVDKQTFQLKELCLQPLKLWKTMTKPRPKRWALFLSTAILVIGYCFTIGVFSVLTLYFLNRPFCWGAIDIGNFLGTQMVALVIGTVIGMKVFLKFMPEFGLATLSPFLGSVGLVMTALATSKGLVYGALFVRGFGGLYTPVYRAVLSKVVEPTEQGSIFSVVSSVEMLFVFLSNFVYNSSYSKLNDVRKASSFFFIPAGFMLIPVFLSMIFWYFWRKENNEEIKPEKLEANNNNNNNKNKMELNEKENGDDPAKKFTESSSAYIGPYSSLQESVETVDASEVELEQVTNE